MNIYYLSYAATTIIVALQIACGFGLEVTIGYMGIQIQYGRGTDDCRCRTTNLWLGPGTSRLP